MSNIRLQGNPSGTGTLTIASPNTNSDFTLNLPTANGTIPLLATVTNNGVMFINGSGQPTTGSALTFDGSTFKVTTGAGGISAFFTDATYSSLKIDHSDTGGLVKFLNGANQSMLGLSSTYLNFYVSATEQMRLTSTGLGIGTSSPAQKLHVLADTSGALFQGATLGGVTFLKTGQTGMQLFSDATGTLKVYDNNAGAAVLTVSNQNVGIGTSSPSYSLDVITPNTNGFAGARIRNNDTGSSAYAGLILNANGNTWSMRMGSVAANSNALQFVVDQLGSPTVRATLDTSGNLGLGVTPSAWGSGWVATQVAGGGAALASRNTNPEVYLTANAHYSGTNWIYKTSSVATQYSQDTGVHKWWVAPSGTAGNAISFTQAMTLDANRTLEVTGAIRSILNSGQGGQSLIGAISGVSNGYEVSVTTGNVQNYYWHNGGTRSMTLDSSGNLLVGTTTNTNSSRIVSNGVVESTTGGFRFPDGTTQTTAASGVPTTLYAVGTYILGRPTNTTQYLADSTLAGSSLRNTGPFGYWNGSNLVSALTGDVINSQSPTVNVGTWRCVSVALGGAAAGAGMWLRIS